MSNEEEREEDDEEYICGYATGVVTVGVFEGTGRYEAFVSQGLYDIVALCVWLETAGFGDIVHAL